jgi:hypothetical protein
LRVAGKSLSGDQNRSLRFAKLQTFWGSLEKEKMPRDYVLHDEQHHVTAPSPGFGTVLCEIRAAF